MNKEKCSSISVLAECRLFLGPDGHTYAKENYGFDFWKRYQQVFDEVCVCARVGKTNTVTGLKIVDINNVRVLPLPYYQGPLFFVIKLPVILLSIYKYSLIDTPFILRIPSILAFFMSVFLVMKGKPYSVELVGNGSETFSNESSTHVLRRFFKWTFIRTTNFIVKHSKSVSYVTKYTLQKLYPAPKGAFTTHYSSIQLRDHEFSMREDFSLRGPLKLITIGSMEVPYKRIETAIMAVGEMNKQGVHCTLTIVGDGILRPTLEKLAKSLGLEQHIEFLGQINDRTTILKLLDDADIFILCSSTEGLPRVIIEAMSRGLPVVATAVGGNPELVDKDFMFPVGDVLSLSRIIMKLACDAHLRKLTSDRNYLLAQEFSEEVISERRKSFYQNILNSNVS